MPLKVPDWINTSIWKHILTLISGSGLAQVVTLLSLPILTRLYQPEEFGILAVFLAALAVMTVAINGGYDMALMLPEKDEEARKILLLCQEAWRLCFLKRMKRLVRSYFSVRKHGAYAS